MKCGIVGLPNVGKSTLFNCLSNAKAESANFPFCTIEPNIGMVTVPDQRIEAISEIVKPERVLPAVVEIVDIAGLVKGASKGEGLGNKFLSNIRETTAIAHVLRCFEDPNIVHVNGTINPIGDKEIIDAELQIKDLETVEKRLEKEKKMSKGGQKSVLENISALEEMKNQLEQGTSIRSQNISENAVLLAQELQLLTAKPVLYICNVDDSGIDGEGNDFVIKVKEMATKENAEVVVLSMQTEAEIAQLETYEERKEFLDALGWKQPGVHTFIQSVYGLLGLQTYFTAGVKEVRAWTIPKICTAPQAAGVIHSDFEKGFIRAEVVAYDDFITNGGETKCKELGKLRQEGKEYKVQDGDIMHFRFNV